MLPSRTLRDGLSGVKAPLSEAAQLRAEVKRAADALERIARALEPKVEMRLAAAPDAAAPDPEPSGWGDLDVAWGRAAQAAAKDGAAKALKDAAGLPTQDARKRSDAGARDIEARFRAAHTADAPAPDVPDSVGFLESIKADPFGRLMLAGSLALLIGTLAFMVALAL